MSFYVGLQLMMQLVIFSLFSLSINLTTIFVIIWSTKYQKIVKIYLELQRLVD